MKKQKKARQKGFALLYALGLVALIGGGIFTFISRVRSSQTSQALIDAKAEFAYNLKALQLVFEDQTSCQYSGLARFPGHAGVQVNLADPDDQPITIHLPGNLGLGPVLLQEGMVTGLLKVPVGGLRITRMVLLGTGAGFARYAATLHLVQEPTSRTQGGRGQEQDVFVTLDLDGSNEVIACSAGGFRMEMKDYSCDTYAVGPNGDVDYFAHPGVPSLAGLQRPACNIATDPSAVEVRCDPDMRVVSCTPRCRAPSGGIRKCVAHPTNGNTSCWGQCIDTDGNVCGLRTVGGVLTGASRGWAQVNMTCTPN